MLTLNLAMIVGLVIIGLSAHSLGVLAAGGHYAAGSSAIGLGILAVTITNRAGSHSKAPTLVAGINAAALMAAGVLVLGTASGREDLHMRSVLLDTAQPPPPERVVCEQPEQDGGPEARWLTRVVGVARTAPTLGSIPPKSTVTGPGREPAEGLRRTRRCPGSGWTGDPILWGESARCSSERSASCRALSCARARQLTW